LKQEFFIILQIPDIDYPRALSYIESMAITITPIENHREREKGIIIYPVYSRRSGGLSVGVNLFPDKKQCPFDCPYCEVFPFSTNAVFSLSRMETDLKKAVTSAIEQKTPVKDICFSGNGEPSLSPFFPDALELANHIRDELVPSAELVLITNGAGLLQPRIFSLLETAATGSIALNIWLKLDAGTPRWYEKLNRTGISFTDLTAKIKEFVSRAPVTIQTMLCAVDGNAPEREEETVWEQLVLEIADSIREVQLYGKARPSPEDPKTTSLPREYLEKRADSLREKLNEVKNPPFVEVYL
jgi:histidinol dehydrogenase